MSVTSGMPRSSAIWQSGFHPDYAPEQGIEKIVRNEIFKEIWNEIDRLDQGVSARGATARSAAAA